MLLTMTGARSGRPLSALPCLSSVINLKAQGHSFSLQTCCKPQWYNESGPVDFSSVLASILKRTYASGGPKVAA